jgi:ubiquinol-cytochrome c reductase cytochrome c1 subunit
MGGHKVHPVHREWNWKKHDWTTAFTSLDWNAVRRGRQVYTEVFAPCHPLQRLTFNHFQAFMTKEEIKKLASQVEVVETTPDAEGKLVPRAGKPTDWLPLPYPNTKAAQFANNGAEPPDLRTIVFAVGDHIPLGGSDYIFSLLTGYHWAETLGVPDWIPPLRPGQFWNPYFKGGIISMPPPLSDGLIEYEDGTPATMSQMAKDVVNFLRWTVEIVYDENRMINLKGQVTVLLMTALLYHFQVKNVAWRMTQRVSFRFWKHTW